MADLLFREIDFYRDGSVVTRDEVRRKCVANLTFVFHSLAAHADVDVSPASTPARRARSPGCRCRR